MLSAIRRLRAAAEPSVIESTLLSLVRPLDLSAASRGRHARRRFAMRYRQAGDMADAGGMCFRRKMLLPLLLVIRFLRRCGYCSTPIHISAWHY